MKPYESLHGLIELNRVEAIPLRLEEMGVKSQGYPASPWGLLQPHKYVRKAEINVGFTNDVDCSNKLFSELYKWNFYAFLEFEPSFLLFIPISEFLSLYFLQVNNPIKNQFFYLFTNIG